MRFYYTTKRKHKYTTSEVMEKHLKNNFGKEALKAYFKDTVEKFEQYWNDPEQFNKIFTELGFTYVDDGCDGFWPECEKMMKCAVYKELKPEWDRFIQSNQ